MNRSLSTLSCRQVSAASSSPAAGSIGRSLAGVLTQKDFEPAQKVLGCGRIDLLASGETLCGSWFVKRSLLSPPMQKPLESFVEDHGRTDHRLQGEPW